MTDDSIKNNVAFGIDEKQIDENKVWQALKKAKLDDFVKSLPKGIKTEVMNAINGLKGSKTIIMIAHRLSTIKNCDTVYEVKNGMVKKCNREFLR